MAKAKKQKPKRMWAVLVGDYIDTFYDSRAGARLAASWVAGGRVVRVSVQIVGRG